MIHNIIVDAREFIVHLVAEGSLVEAAIPWRPDAVSTTLAGRSEAIRNRKSMLNGIFPHVKPVVPQLARAAGDAFTDGLRAQAPPGFDPHEFLNRVAEGSKHLCDIDMVAITAEMARAVGAPIRITPRLQAAAPKSPLPSTNLLKEQCHE